MMNALINFSPDVVGGWVAFVLTLLVFSYLLGDNALYRLAIHLFIGAVVGYSVVIAWYSVFWPSLLKPLLTQPTEDPSLLVPLILGVLLLCKGRVSLAWLGNVSMAFLFGVGAALAIGGALMGVLHPQIEAAISLNLARNSWMTALNNFILLVGTIGALFYFYFRARPERGLGRFGVGFIRGWAGLGRWFIMIAFGAVFANLAIARLTLLIERLQFLVSMIRSWIG